MTKITIDRAVVQQALEALEYHVEQTRPIHRTSEAITTLHAALAEPTPMPPFPPVSLWKRGCAVCGIGAGGHAYGCVCPRSDCPTRITCGGAV
jgi:hypothetical protein